MGSCRLQRSIRCSTLHLHGVHARGRVLIEEGVNDHSRAGSLDVAGPDSTDRVRDRARRLAAACVWSLTLCVFHLSVWLGIAGEGAGVEAVGLRGQDALTSSGL